MRHFKLKLLAVLTPCLMAGFAQAEIIHVNKEDFLPQQQSQASDIFKISNDGSVVIGEHHKEDGTKEHYYYNLTTGEMLNVSGIDFGQPVRSVDVHDVSADGSVVVGTFRTPNSPLSKAYRYDVNTGEAVYLGALNDNPLMNASTAKAVSDDGRVVIGFAMAPGYAIQAFRHSEGDTNMTGLGTFKTNNTGHSSAYDVSSDGRVVVGAAQDDRNEHKAFRHNEHDTALTNLGTLKEDNSGVSYAHGVSGDGHIVVGHAQNELDEKRAFIHYEGADKVLDLGALTSDGRGDSSASGISKNGEVVIGKSVVDSNTNGVQDQHAFRYDVNADKMTDLGTLKADNTGNSYTTAISNDGKVIVGAADSDSGDERAFYHHQNDDSMTDLGTLRADNQGKSEAKSVTGDGQVVVGVADTDEGVQHGVIWKVKREPKPIDPETPEPEVPEVIVIDKDNTNTALSQAAHKAQRVMGLYQNTLTSLTDARCQIGPENYCVGLFGQYDRTTDNHRVAGGLFAAMRVAPQWVIGGSMNFAQHASLIDGYKTRGGHQPGVGLYTAYQANQDGSGLGVSLAGAMLAQKISITRDQLSHTEAGKGDSKIKGHQVDLGVRYGFNVNETTQLSPKVNLVHTNLRRDAYTEGNDIELPATYGRMGDKRTELGLGLAMNHHLASNITLDSEVGVNVRLKQDRQAFMGAIDYVGAVVSDQGANPRVRPYLGAGVSVGVSQNSFLRLSTGWEKSNYDLNVFNAGVQYSYAW